MKFRYYLKFHGAWMAFCRVIEGKISALQVEYPAPKNLVITIEFTTNTTGYSLSTASCKEHAFQVLSNLAKRYWRWSCLNEKVNVHTHGRTMDKTVSQTLTLSLCDTWAKKQQHNMKILAYLWAMWVIIQVFPSVWVGHSGRVTTHYVEVGPGCHSSLGMPLHLYRVNKVQSIIVKH